MEYLIELSKIVSNHRVTRIETMGYIQSKNSLFNKFYDGLVNESIKDDETAAEMLYNSTPDDSRYKKLKSRLKSKLINTLFFVDLESAYSQDIQREFHDALKNWVAVSILLSRGARKSAIELASRMMKSCLKYEFTEIAISYARELRNHFSMIDSHQKKFLKYDRLLNGQVKLYQAEILAERYYGDIRMRMGSKKQSSNQSELLNLTAQYSSELKEICRKSDSFRLYRFAYLVLTTDALLRKEWERILTLSQEVIEYFSTKSFATVNSVLTFHMRMVMSHIQIQNYSQAAQILSQYDGNFALGTYNWFVIKYYSVIVAFHSKSYGEAIQQINNVIGSSKFKNQAAFIKENFMVFKAYGNLLLEMGKISEGDLDQLKAKKFSIYKFLNDVPIFSKDKSGLNISILIVHVLFLLLRKKYDEIIDRVDSLSQYKHRHLRDEVSMRSNYFINMLLQVPKRDFHPVATERHAEPWKKKLHNTPMNIAEQGIEVEVIPYEALWEMVIEILEKR